MQKFTSPRDCFPRKTHGEVRLQTEFTACLRHTFDEIEDIGRTTARKRRHGIDIGFRGHPLDRPRDAQKGMDALTLLIADP